MMKVWKMFSAFLVLALLVVGTPISGWAATGDSNFTNIVASGDITLRSNLLVNGLANGGTLIKQSSSTALSTAELAYSVIQKRVGGAGGLDNDGIGSVLANGTPGQVIHLVVIFQQTNGSWDITPTTKTGFTTVTLNAVGESVTLLYVNDTIGWIIIGSTVAAVA